MRGRFCPFLLRRVRAARAYAALRRQMAYKCCCCVPLAKFRRILQFYKSSEILDRALKLNFLGSFNFRIFCRLRLPSDLNNFRYD